MLQRLALPNFGTSNWKSTIRKETRVCEKYRNLDPWIGVETSNIVYKDTTGALGNILVNKGYIPSVPSGSPTYYLEVNTRTGQCNEPFLLSAAQYRPVSHSSMLPDYRANIRLSDTTDGASG